MVRVPDEVLAAMFVFCFAGWYVAWRAAKRGNASPSPFSVATMASQLTGVIFLSVIIVAAINNYYQNGVNRFSAFMPAKSNSSAHAQPGRIRPYHPPAPFCPDYFRWIHEDLWPWQKTGITEEMIEKGKKSANFRLVVLNGTLYLESYRKSFQTRDKFTIWGILQLLQKYPGRIPDLDLIFYCHDFPQVKLIDYVSRDLSDSSSWTPPPIFGYCSDEDSLDIVFPDWSFWGWAEINIKPWNILLKELMEGNKKASWFKREPYAYWKGNTLMSPIRRYLMECNPAADGSADWNIRAFYQDWIREIESGFPQSNLADQCNYRYKIYVEGKSWSVSKKYILACDSTALLIDSKYHDFFSRGLMPMQHYYPINVNFTCGSINSTVTFGNTHQQEAQEIGREGSAFIENNLKMDRVYDYMFHLLKEYSKLMRFKPKVPKNAIKISSESMVENETGLVKGFMMDSRVKPDQSSSYYYQYKCKLPAPFTKGELKSLLHRKDILGKQTDFHADEN